MEYMRKMIYLKKREHEMVMSGQGFARMELRAGNFLLHLSMCGVVLPGDHPVYIVYEKDGSFFASMAGTTGYRDTIDIRCPVEELPGELLVDHICGVLAGNRECYLSGLSVEYSGPLLYEQIEFAKRTEPVPEPETVPPAGEMTEEEIVKEEIAGEEMAEEEMPAEEMSAEEMQKKVQEEVQAADDQPGEEPSFLKGLSEMYPFEDDEIEWCYQMKPEDFNQFPMEYWHYTKNSFLLQGFYNYRHLVYAHTKDKNYIGVPGQYIRKERYLAVRFGFSHFKQIRKKKLSMGDYGYWMKEV